MLEKKSGNASTFKVPKTLSTDRIQSSQQILGHRVSKDVRFYHENVRAGYSSRI